MFYQHFILSTNYFMGLWMTKLVLNSAELFQNSIKLLIGTLLKVYPKILDTETLTRYKDIPKTILN